MIQINGAEGGGQLLRTALGLSAVTNKPFKMVDIRKNRPNPGIKEQHLQAINAMAELCDAETLYAELGSDKLEFYPKEIKSGNIHIKISTAGSVGLVLQALLIPAVKKDQRIIINGGGTFGLHAPPIHFIERVMLPLLEKMGYRCKIEIEKEGFYPKGGAKINIHSYKGELKIINFIEKGKVIECKGISLASQDLRKAEVAERQSQKAKRILKRELDLDCKIEIKYVAALSIGSGIQLWIKTENSVLGGDSLGEKGKPSEIIGYEAAQRLVEDYQSGCVDEHAGDFLMPYMALVGGGKIKVRLFTDHMKSNAQVIEQFLPVRFKFENNIIECQQL